MIWRPERLASCFLLGVLVATCVVGAAVEASPTAGSEPLVPPRHRPFAALSSPGVRATTRRTPVRRSAEEADNQERCRDFSVGTPHNNSFKSPNFPNNYPNNTDCVRILDAGPGNVIRIEFREKFHVEPSAGCMYDNLEVRDGRYGYNTPLGLFCGERFPESVTSSGRYLYLRFRTDETIEYEGFTIVYIVLPRPTESPGPELTPCFISLSGVEGYVNKSDINRHCPERVNQSLIWHRPLEGMWVINVSLGWKIQLAFLMFKLELPNDCQNNFVQVFKENTDIPSQISEFCGAKAETALSENHIMHVRFFATPPAFNSTFSALFTAYREGNKKPCREDEFDCQDDTCISRSLRCNRRYNCRYRWDEDPDECKKSLSPIAEILSSDHIIIILVIFCLILSGMCFAFIYNCTRKLVRDHRIIREDEADLVDFLSATAPEMRDNECQTRDSLFLTATTNTTSSSDKTDTPPPPPPPPSAALIASRQQLHSHSGSASTDRSRPPPLPPAAVLPPFSTFGHRHPGSPAPMLDYSSLPHHHNHGHHRHGPPPPPPPPPAPEQRFRAEAVIEVDARRPYSVASTKSAPDVIVTH